MIVAEESFGTAVDSVFCCLTDGRCCLKYSPDGRFIYSVGADGNLAATPAGKELHLENQLLCRFHMASVTCMDVCDRFVVTGSTDMSVGMYGAGEELKAVKALTRMALPVRSVSIHPNQKHVACSGDAAEIVVVDVEDVRAAPKVGRKHARPVSCLAYDPKGKFLASIDIAGELVIWAVTEDGCIAVEDSAKVAIPAKFWPRLAWSPDGALLAVTGDDEIKLVGRDTWVTEKIIKINDLHKECQDLAWGHDGSFLASHDASKLVVWNLADGTPCKAVSFASGLFALAFAPQDCLSEVLTIDKEGILRRRRGCFQDGEIRELRAFLSSRRKTNKGALTQLADKAKEKAKAKEKEEKLKKDKKRAKKTAEGAEMRSMERKYMLSEAEDDGEEDGEGIGEEDEEEGESIDLDNTSGGESGYDSLDDYDLDDDAELDKTFAEAKPVTPVAVPPMQPVVQHPSFQPGATEPREDTQQRYLAWNVVGLIVSRKDEAGYNSIDIEFHDRVSMRPVRFTDDVGYTMAALSADGAVFASPGGEGRASTVHFMAFETWTGRQYWSVALEEGERATGVAIASNGVERPTVLVATSHGWLRSFSPSGLPGPTITFGHELVTMTAGAGKLLLVLDDRGALLTRCYAVASDTFPRLTFEGHLGRRADLNRLLWVGISEAGLVGAFDQTGILYGLCDRLGHCWTPLGDFTSQLSEGQFVWPVFWDRTELTCILCKDDTAPPVLPRPIMTTLEIRLPVLSTGDDLSAQILGTVMKTMTLDSAISGSAGVREKEMRRIRTASDKHCLELIQLAVKADKQVRALELCALFYNEKSFELAYQLARHNRMATLADRIEEARDLFAAKQNNTQEHSLVETPKGAIPPRIDRESPSAILANLTPVQRTVADLHATEESLGSPLRSAAKRKIELVADHNDIDRIEEECRQARLPLEGEDESTAWMPAPREEEYLLQPDLDNTAVAESAEEKKPAGLLDMLGALSAKSAAQPVEPMGKSKAAAAAAAPVKENVQPNQTMSEPPKKKQASLSSMFRKP